MKQTAGTKNLWSASDPVSLRILHCAVASGLPVNQLPLLTGRPGSHFDPGANSLESSHYDLFVGIQWSWQPYLTQSGFVFVALLRL